MHQVIKLERQTKIRLNRQKTKKALQDIATAATRNRKYGLAVTGIKFKKPEPIEGPEGSSEHRYVVRIRLTTTKAGSPAKVHACLRHAHKAVVRSAKSRSWQVISKPPVEPQIEQAKHPALVERLPLQLPDLTPEVIEKAFNGIYEREEHVRLIHDSFRTYAATRGQKTSHVLLYGEPAAAKTSLFERFKDLYEQGSDIDRVVFLDAQTMTKAGLEDWLLGKAEEGSLPEVVVVEELEKQDEKILLPLISVMGSGYVMKTNARVGRRVEQIRLVVWGTCNNVERLKKFHDGALWSRFTHKLPCRRPSREVMRKILLREIEARQGNPAWAQLALTLGYDELQTTDPREIIGLLDGGDRLLTGEYQRDYLAVHRKADRMQAA